MTAPSDPSASPDESDPFDKRETPAGAAPTDRPQRLGRPGRPLGPVAADCSSAHRAWLEPVRDAYRRSGQTMSQLGTQLHMAKSKISELLSGRMYPRWEVLYPLAVELRIPYSPLFRLWAQAAVKTHNKSRTWVDDSVAGVAVTTRPAAPPLDHKAFRKLTEDGYRDYASVFLADDCCGPALDDTYDQLWLRWTHVLSSPDARRYAWDVLRTTVMALTPHIDGRPEFSHAAFDTVAMQAATDQDAALRQLHETLGLYKAMSRLPDHQLDVIVLRRLRAMPTETVSDLLGAPLATVRSDERHATRFLETALTAPNDLEGNQP